MEGATTGCGDRQPHVADGFVGAGVDVLRALVVCRGARNTMHPTVASCPASLPPASFPLLLPELPPSESSLQAPKVSEKQVRRVWRGPDPGEPSDACPPGMVCVDLQSPLQPDLGVCMYAGEIEPPVKDELGDECMAGSCVEGTQCIQAIPLDIPRCHASCDDSASPLCPNGQTCIPTTTGLGACQFGGPLGLGAECESDGSCTIGTACRKDAGETLGECVVVCEVSSPNCSAGETCVPSDIWNNTGGFCEAL